MCSLLSRLFLIMLGVVPGLSAQRIDTLRTKQTIIELRADDTAPRILSVATPGLPKWNNQINDELIHSVLIDGISKPLVWKIDVKASRSDKKHVSYIYRTTSPHLQLTWEWQVQSGAGPIEHRIFIKNFESHQVWIPLQDSLQAKFSVPGTQSLQHIYVDKGAGKPSLIGTHQVVIPVGYRWKGSSSTYANDEGPREIIPWSMVQRNGNSEDGWYVGIEFSGRTSISHERDQTSLQVRVGLNPDPAPFLTCLQPAGAFETPSVFLGAFRGGRDIAGNVLRPWVRHVLTNAKTWTNPNYPLMVNNSWGSGMQVDEPLAKRMIQDSAELGLEMFHLDAGWFRGVGDWYPASEKFPHGLAPLSDEAHSLGLKFGIWVNWAQAGIDENVGALNVNDVKVKDWLVADVPPNWQPDQFVGRTIDLGVPAAKLYAERELARIVTSYKLDMIEHDGYLVARACSRTDHLHAAPETSYISTVEGSGAVLPLASNSTDVSYHAVRSYYSIYSKLRREHPNLLFEICNDGGRMVDFGSASHGDYFSITDSYDPIT